MDNNLTLSDGVGLVPPPIVVPSQFGSEPAKERPGVSVLFDAVTFEKQGDQYVLRDAGGAEVVRLDARNVLKCRRTPGASR